LGREARRTVAPEVRRNLVNTLFASTRSLVAGVAASSVISFAVATQAKLWPTTAIAYLILAAGSGRLALQLAFRAARRKGRGESQGWERAYQLGAAVFSGLLGLFAVLTLLMARDPRLHMLATAMAIGFSAGVAKRNAGRPAIAITQLALVCLPLAAGLLLTANGLYLTLGVVTLLFLAAMIDGVLQTHKVLVQAFNSAQENRSLIEAVETKASEALAANAAKTRFLANMSHEIRTPLNGVLGMADVMLNDSLSDQQRARLKVIRQSGDALMALLNDILDLSKVEAGRLETESAPFDLGDLLANLTATFEEVAASRRLGFAIVVPASDLGVYEGDAGRLRQILVNLISNALKFTEAGRVEVKVAFTRGALEVAVSDTGIGFSPDHLKRLFSRFSQADASITRRFGGSGLGLAICQELTLLLKGRIWAESRLGEGSTFFISIPLVPIAATEVAVPHTQPAETPPPIETAPAAPPIVSDQAAPSAETGLPEETGRSDEIGRPEEIGRKLRLLCAEDNEVNQMVLKALLEPYDYDLIVVDDGRQALEAYKTEAFDLVLLDIQMPVMDGPTAAAAIRVYETQTNRREVPIIALTANVMADQVQSYLASGMNQVVPKPIDIDELYTAIERHLRRMASLETSESAPSPAPRLAAHR